MKNPFTRLFKEKVPMRGEIGATGTQLFSGFISEEFNPDLAGRAGLITYDKMRKSDAQIHASLEALKVPLLNARWYIEPSTSDEIDENLAIEQAQFIEEILMDKLKWKKQLRLILTSLDFGFKYLEKVFGFDDNGKIIWTKWGDRQQSAHYKWADDNDNIGVQQQLPNADTKNSTPFIPMDKLLLFTYLREGNNYEGQSVLRTAYKHWWFKDTLYKIQGISAERYGVGIPTTKMGENNSAADKSSAEEMTKNVRSNESNYMVLPSGWEFDIKTPTGNPMGQAISEGITHHNRMIVMNILAPFLDLGSGSTGSFALSQDQSKFFLLGLQSIADMVIDVIDDAIKELILLNWSDTKKFPKLKVTDISSMDLDIFASALNTLASGGLLDIDDGLKAFIRDTAKLPDLPEDYEPEEEEIEEELKEEMTENGKKKRQFSMVKISQREKIFGKYISLNESIIKADLVSFNKELKNTEKKVKTFLLNKFSNAKTIDKNGVICIKNQVTLYNDIKSGVNDIMRKFKLKVSGNKMSREMLKKTAKNAILANSEMKKTEDYATSISIAKGQINSFLAGHISNMDAVVYNEGRHILENMHDNITQEVSLSLIEQQIRQIQFNRNIFNLSVTAHPRALFRNIISALAVNEGVKYFKMVVPENRKSDLTPNGITLALLFLILTKKQWDEKTGVKNNVDTVGGLGTHHNSFEYFYPVYTEDLKEEEEIAKEQRANLTQ